MYTVKVNHKTGSPTKRKLEKELNTESSKRRKLEHELTQAASELNMCKDDNGELQRKLDRLSNLNKLQQGERGRTKGKIGYSESQKRRHKHKKSRLLEIFWATWAMLDIVLSVSN